MTPQEALYKSYGKINKDLEPYFIKDPRCIYFYAKLVIKGRWIEAEQYIIEDSGWSLLYARDVIKGKLPENMHNMMLLHADLCAKLYLEFIKNKP
jgi:hypothetical protein